MVRRSKHDKTKTAYVYVNGFKIGRKGSKGGHAVWFEFWDENDEPIGDLIVSSATVSWRKPHGPIRPGKSIWDLRKWLLDE